ncbi:MAG: ribbon-helix-helix protein, CopG family [Methanomassiliicoccales archaeon]|nr:MAG: ribbon-helix-helix protein, CopG family [Methanomassiliicoccales archaeon]
MTIISMSVNENLLERFDEVSHRKGYTTRSEALRDAIRNIVREDVWDEAIEGNIVVIIVLYEKNRPKSEISHLHHKFEEIQTNIHMHLDDSNCLEIFIAKGEGARLKGLTKRIREIKGIKQVEFITTACDI